jgi:Mu-like prophage I protein
MTLPETRISPEVVLVADYSGLMVVPSQDPDFVELSRTKQGRLFRKHILSTGPLYHPKTGQRIEITESYLDKVVSNFQAKVCPIVQFPAANERNEHTEDPLRNLGEVIDLKREGNKLYSYIDARDAKAADGLGKTLLGASALLHTNYRDTRTNTVVGPTLLHVCATNRPYLTDLDSYEEVVAATSDSQGDEPLVMLAHHEQELPVSRTLADILTELKEEHGIDVAALQAQQTELTNALSASGLIQLTNGETLTSTDVASAVSALAESHLALTNSVTELRTKDAAREVDDLIQAGRIIPAQRETYVDLRLSNAELFDKLVPETAILAFSAPAGVGSDDEAKARKAADEVARLTAPGGAAADYVAHAS